MNPYPTKRHRRLCQRSGHRMSYGILCIEPPDGEVEAFRGCERCGVSIKIGEFPRGEWLQVEFSGVASQGGQT